MFLLRVFFVLILTVAMGSAVAKSGNIAYSADGNFHDKDDLCATAMAISVAAEAGRKNSVVHVDYNNHLGKSGGQANTHKANVEKMRGHYGYAANIFFDDRTQAAAAASHGAAQIDKATAGNRLWYICAGPMEMCWRAANQSNKANRGNTTFVSHHKWNDNHADTPQLKHKWGDVCKTGVKCDHINDQNNTAFKSKNWGWLTKYGQKGVDLEKITKAKGGDCSDAGMMMYVVKDNKNAKMAQVEALWKGGSSSSSSSSSSSGGGECKTKADCNAIYNGNLKKGWKVKNCAKKAAVCKCKKGKKTKNCKTVTK